jgi:hypothetical protein
LNNGSELVGGQTLLENENENHNKEISSANNVKIPEQAIAPSIFTKEEIATTVRSFLLAWIKNDVKIHFPTAEELQYRAKQGGIKKDMSIAIDEEREGKIEFLNKILVVSGKFPATPQQQETAITELFKDILCFRCGDRIRGTFGKKEDYDARLSRIEEQIEAMNTAIQELIIYYRSMTKP